MTLTNEELDTLNGLLRNPKLDIPDFRRTVNHSGGNYKWLQRNIGVRNKELSPKLRQLLELGDLQVH